MGKKTSTFSANANRSRSLPPLSRETFDLYWLNVRDQTVTTRPFGEYRLKESAGSRKHVRLPLARALVDHHINRQRIADRLKQLNHEKAAEFFANEMPKEHNTRMGNFGEVVASEHLIQRYGASMPVFKLRYRERHDLPMRGEDIVAFEIDAYQKISKVIIGEAKTIKGAGKNAVHEAHQRLRSAFAPRPMTLSMLANILYDKGDENLGRQIDDLSATLARKPFPRANWLFLINSREDPDPFETLVEKADAVDDLVCANLALRGLAEFVNELFDTALNSENIELNAT